ncbi:MAG: MptD family putative ECF transporter S component [Tissierellia bacterium]|nr:MptD family putative ECF transporter S component [Tissierellia bacterium]
MKSRDYISLGIYTALFFVVIMLVVFITSMSIVAYAFGITIAAIPAAIIYILMRLKVKKKGSVLLSGLVIAALEFLIGAGWPIALAMAIGSLIAELITQRGQYEKFWPISIGYSIFMTCTALGTYGPIIFMKDYISKQSASNKIDPNYMNALLNFLQPKILIIILISTFVSAILGCLISKRILNKNFKKAGII